MKEEKNMAMEETAKPGMTRRQFMKGMALGAASLSLAAILQLLQLTQRRQQQPPQQRRRPQRQQLPPAVSISTAAT